MWGAVRRDTSILKDSPGLFGSMTSSAQTGKPSAFAT